MESPKFVAFTVVLLFGVNLIVSGVPVDKSTAAPTTTTPAPETTTLVADNSTEGNGTHKEL
jgi:hypothetical protein